MGRSYLEECGSVSGILSSSRYRGSVVPFVSIAAALALAATACGSSPSSPSGPNASQPYVLGAEADQSCPSAASGKPMVAGIRAAVDGMSKRGGVNGHKVNVVARDDAADNARGIANVREMIQQFKASAIIGVNISAVASALIPVVQELQVPFVSSGIPSTKITPAQQYVYMYGADLSPQGIAQLKEVKQLSDTGKIPAKPRIAALHYATPAGQSWIKTVQDNLASITGGSMVSVENFPVNVTDLGTQISKINAAKPDVVILFAAQNIMAIATQALRSAGVSPTLWMI